MRKRFRGNQPISTSNELEGVGGGKYSIGGEGRQLYGGKEAFGVPVREEGRGEKEGLGFDEEKTRGL